MQKASITLANCYGIRSLEATFDFTKKEANIVYAPNGMMKTSFANTFRDYSNDIESRDRIYSDREPLREIKDENGKDIPAEEIFVIEPYLSDYESTRISTLLVNKELKDEYDKILKGIDAKQRDLTALLKSSSGIKSNLEDELSIVI
ncbi:MAG: phage infection protein, partial [Hyphomicrobiales bacterium]